MKNCIEITNALGAYKDNKLHIKLKKHNKDKSYILTLNKLLEKMC